MDKSVEAVKQSLKKRVLNDLTHHAPTPEQIAKYTDIRAFALEFANLLVESVPLSRELSTALTKLEEVVMHANAGIARA